MVMDGTTTWNSHVVLTRMTTLVFLKTRTLMESATLSIQILMVMESSILRMHSRMILTNLRTTMVTELVIIPITILTTMVGITRMRRIVSPIHWMQDLIQLTSIMTQYVTYSILMMITTGTLTSMMNFQKTLLSGLITMVTLSVTMPIWTTITMVTMTFSKLSVYPIHWI